MGFVGFNLVFGMTMPNVDVAAHVGGLVGGLLCGLVARPILPPRAVPTLIARLSILAPVCVCVAAAGILLLPQPGLDFSWELNKFLAIEPKLNARYNAIMSETNSGQTPSERAKIIQRDVVGPWRQERERMADFKNVKPEDRAAWQTILSYIAAREESFDLMAQSIGEEDPLKQRQAIQKLILARANLENWVRKDGPRYGLSLPKLPTARD
jgi:rhomboid protease GluP